MAVQPQPGAGVRELARVGRGGGEGPAGLARGPRPLPLHLRPRLPSPRRLPPPHRPRRPPLRPHLLRQGLGPQVLQKGCHRVPLLAGSPTGAAELT